ncbi:hypothetical protein GCM10009602_18760 [Nocardiopsis tropica]
MPSRSLFHQSPFAVSPAPLQKSTGIHTWPRPDPPPRIRKERMGPGRLFRFPRRPRREGRPGEGGGPLLRRARGRGGASAPAEDGPAGGGNPLSGPAPTGARTRSTASRGGFREAREFP